MRISIPSLPSAASLSLRGTLESGGYVVADEFPSYTVTLQDMLEGDDIVIDAPDACFGRLVAQRVGSLAPNGGVFLACRGGNQNDRAVVIGVPAQGKALEAVCTGVLRALDQTRQFLAQPAQSQGQPFADVPEILATLARGLEAHQRDQTQTVTAALEQHTVALVGAFDRRCDGLHEALTAEASRIRTIQQGTADLVTGAVIAQRMRLFDDLLTYYARPRWWQWRFWASRWR